MTPGRPSPEFLQVFAKHADENGTMAFDAFMQLALYDPQVGYYRADRPRVGYGPGTDFFTSTTSGPVFGELICAAAAKLLGNRAVAGHTFVEIGAENGRGVLDGVVHPFAAARTVRVGEPFDLSGPCVVFSNELFDAQPFRRFRFNAGVWRELGVRLDAGQLIEAELPGAAQRPLPGILPAQSAEGYVIDAPLAAAALARALAAQTWTGLFLTCDYGKGWRELIEACPAGTARAYFQHKQSNDLLERPGQQDLTCHVCWDWLKAALQESGFQELGVETQESFFIHNAESYLAPAIQADAARFTRRKQALLQLLHGSQLGQKFQVLHGLR